MDASSRRIIVMVNVPVPAWLLQRIRAADDRLVVHSAQDGPPAAEPEVALGVPADVRGGLDGFVRRHPALRWVQLTDRDASAAGGTLAADASERVVVTDAAAVDAGPLAEFALAGILSHAKQLPGLVAEAGGGRRPDRASTLVAGSTLLVVGLGPAGAETARLGHAFGMQVLGINRDGRGAVPGVEAIRPTWFLRDLLPVSHAVVVTVPRTAQTQGMIGAREIARMRRDAVLVDVSGGGVVDAHSLADGLRQGRPAAAVLDGFTVDGFSRGHPLWGRPDVLVGDEATGSPDARAERVGRFFLDDLRRYLRGQPLHGLRG